MLEIKSQANAVRTHLEVAFRFIIDGLEAKAAFERNSVEIRHLEMIAKDDSYTEVKFPNACAGAIFRIDFIEALCRFGILPEQFIQVKIVKREITLDLQRHRE